MAKVGYVPRALDSLVAQMFKLESTFSHYFPDTVWSFLVRRKFSNRSYPSRPVVIKVSRFDVLRDHLRVVLFGGSYTLPPLGGSWPYFLRASQDLSSN